ncbi:MAG: tRNA threonylcarbamoyladenosine dehydratase [Erysipelotrichaceae bacterium]|nr:tRNA threonylcarbamoyladenosine dehydratase [Erysipelotrichaceae bacterium]
MNNQFERVVNVLGEENLARLQNSHVAVFGLGGVGSYAVEALGRSGVGTLTLVDYDRVETSNLNRQLEATWNTLKQDKTEAVAERLLSINPDIKVIKKKVFVDDDTVGKCLGEDVDYVIDAIDNMNGKLAIWKYCKDHDIPFIACLGAARRLDPTKLVVTTLNKTQNDPMARKLRYLARNRGMDLKVKVVYSTEDPLKMNESGVLGSMIFVPATAGLICAEICIREMLNIE